MEDIWILEGTYRDLHLEVASGVQHEQFLGLLTIKK